MRTNLIIIGTIFFVLGLLLYILPTQNVTANTITTEGGNTDTRTSSARVTVPVEWAYASAATGFILLLLGLAIPSTVTTRDSRRGSYERVESKEDVEVDDGTKHQVFRERTVKHNTVKNDD